MPVSERIYGKDMDCPACHGRSFGYMDDTFYGCRVCEPGYATVETQAQYRGGGRACRVAFDRWAQTDEGRRRIAAIVCLEEIETTLTGELLAEALEIRARLERLKERVEDA